MRPAYICWRGSALFGRKMHSPDQSEVRGDIRIKIKHIIKNRHVPHLDKAVLKELGKYYAKRVAGWL